MSREKGEEVGSEGRESKGIRWKFDVGRQCMML